MSDPKACTAPCGFYIGVNGFNGNAVYSLVATVPSTIPYLFDGQPQYGYIVPHVMMLYEFDTTTSEFPPVDVEVNLVPLTGSLELYTMQAVNSYNRSVLPSLNCTQVGLHDGTLRHAHVFSCACLCTLACLVCSLA